MDATPAAVRQVGTDMAAYFDAIVVGARISGFYQLYKLCELGLKVRVFETGTSFRGPWYWNCHPGARFASESYSYGHRHLSRGAVDCQHRGLFQRCEAD